MPGALPSSQDQLTASFLRLGPELLFPASSSCSLLSHALTRGWVSPLRDTVSNERSQLHKHTVVRTTLECTCLVKAVTQENPLEARGRKCWQAEQLMGSVMAKLGLWHPVRSASLQDQFHPPTLQ